MERRRDDVEVVIGGGGGVKIPPPNCLWCEDTTAKFPYPGFVIIFVGRLS